MTSDPIEQGERLLQGQRFDVRAVDVPGSDGRPHRREIVVHPGAVVILPLIDEEHVVLIRNRRIAVGQTLWELPAGTLEPPEPPERCAHRELIEETGYRAGRIEPLTDFYTSPGICTERMWAFAAYDLTHVGQQLEAAEQITVEVAPWARTIQMLRDGAIRDGKTIAALLYYHTFTDRG